MLVFRDLLIEKFDPDFIDEFGDACWTKRFGEYHSNGKKPSIIFADGGLNWHKDGVLHRDNGKPAVIYADGTMMWYENVQFIK